MQPAADRMAEALAAVTIGRWCRLAMSPLEAVIRNVRQLLVEQVTGRVRSRESISLRRGDVTVEFGGKVLTGMVKRIDKDLTNITWNPADLRFWKGALNV
jgi:[acyl-carrier-protein] S-malonyltransferase